MPESVQQFAARIKTKYPDYASVPDAELVDKIIQKYPDYKSQVTFDSKPVQGPSRMDRFTESVKTGTGVPGLMQLGKQSLGEAPEGEGVLGSLFRAETAGPKMLAEIVKGIIKSHAQESVKAKGNFKRGNYGRGIKNTLTASIPMAGPFISGLMDKIERGDEIEAAGELVGGALVPAAGKAAGGALKGAANILRARKAAKVAPVQAKLMDLAERRDIQVDQAEAGQQQFMKSIRAAEASANPFSQAEEFQAGTNADLIRAGAEIGQEMTPAGVPGVTTKYTAGKNVRSRIAEAIKGKKTEAKSEYADLDRIAAERATPIQTGVDVVGDEFAGFQEVPKFKNVAGPVDISKVKQIAKGFVGEIEKQIPLSVRESDPAFRGLKSLASRESDIVDLKTANAELSAFQNASRSKIPEVADKAERLATMIAEPYRQAIDGAVNALGQDAKLALENGRAATRAKYDLRDMGINLFGVKFTGSPVRMVNSLIANEDAGIEALRRVDSFNPALTRDIGRAVFERAMEIAQKEEGKFNGGAAFNMWQRLAPETKKILVKDPEHLAEIDKFFQLAKQTTEEFNPSGSGKVSAMMHGLGLVVGAMAGASTGSVAAALPAAMVPIGGYLLGWKAVSKMLYRKDIARSINKLMQTPAGSPSAKPLASMLYIASILPDNIKRKKDKGGLY